MRKKLIALLTCIAMIIAFSPAVFADDSSDAVISPAPQADWQTAYNIYFAAISNILGFVFQSLYSTKLPK